ncbi:hypothetical protein DH2020_047033 [Rehmannia glutinosa]|uniref:Flowering time control protein FY n=1 Tax=Rehmannia glutinosa TaxID=99300 RepID=A0ABR0U9J3_REHGL
MRQPSASSTTLNPPPPDFHHHQQQHPPAQPPFPGQPPYDAHADSFAAKRMRKIGQRRAVDYTSTVVRYMQIRMFQRDSRDRTVLQPNPAAAIDVCYPPENYLLYNYVQYWTPSGRRLITGSQSGEFTLWNGQSFNFEMILQAHEQAVRSMIWSYNENWMVTGDDGGSIKYWQTNMNNVKANKSAHKESVRGLRTDLKFCSCSDDTTVKVWDFARCQEERSLSGHGWDVKCVDWHPTKSLLVSGGKDNLVKLWDAKSGESCVHFQRFLFAHASHFPRLNNDEEGRRLYDIRAMKELESFRGHRKDVTVSSVCRPSVLLFLLLFLWPFYICKNLCYISVFTVIALAWHPFHEEYFVSGSFDGSIFHWLVGHETPQVEIQNAHDNSVWDLAWHPIGYLLCSGGNDHTTKFWCRNRPGDPARDKINMGPNQGFGEQNPAMGGRVSVPFPVPEPPQLLDHLELGEQKPPLAAPPLPPGPHPSLLMGKQQQPYQQNAPQVQQHQALPQQMSSMPLPPPNLPQLQNPSHLPLLSHPHLPRHPQQLQPLNTSANAPSSMPGSMSIPSMPNSMPGPMPGPMGGMNQMVPQMQGHFMGMNPMPSVSGPPGNMPPGGNQMYQPGGGFNRPPGGQMPMMPGINHYQPGNPNAPGMPSNYNLPSGIPPPLPPGPPPHGQAHQ